VDVFPFETLYEEHRRIAAAADQKGVALRLLGALAFTLRCPDHATLRTELGRELSDLDYVALSKQWDGVIQLLTGLEYEFDERRAMLHGQDRLIFFHPNSLRVDVFFDRLDMCHIVDLRNRLAVDPDTIPLADLLLEKMQIVRLTEKDVIDTFTLLLEHAVTPGDEGISAEHIARRLAYDWGFFHTFSTNMRRVRDEFLNRYPQLGQDERRTVRQRIDQLLDRIEAEPKTARWKLRARVGTAAKWYKDVGDLVR
jgi:hypothetical protein